MYKKVSSIEKMTNPVTGVEVHVALNRDFTKDERDEIDSFVYRIMDKISLNTHLLKQGTIDDHAEEIKSLTALFPEPIFVREINNEYSPYGSHWLLVTTAKGIIKIGWRKRVINIDWTESTQSADANTLFPDEDVTKSGRSIHAWGYEKAKEYINTILK